MTFFHWPPPLSPELVWGLFPRLLGGVYLIAFISLFHQVVPLAGQGGLYPFQPQLQKIRADYPGLRRFFYFPTLLWLCSGDALLRWLVVVGMGGAVWVICGGPGSILGLALCWVCYLSLAPAVGLVYPWDCLLLEAGVLALLLPSPNALPDWSASALPLPAVVWAWRWLLFRVLFGFGKLRFYNFHRQDLGYLHGFLVAVPLPTPLGWYAHHLPRWVHRLGLIFVFLVEVPGAFLILIPGPARLLAAVLIVALMLAIQLTGNYGHFNLLVIVLCVPLFDCNSTLLDQSLDGLFWPWDHLLTHLLAFILFVGGLLYLPLNSWCSQAWLYWPSLQEGRARRLRWVFAFYRFLAPFRLLHAYGVFPSASNPPARAVPVLEGTQDGQTWREYPCRYLMTGPGSPPVWVAPHHPRLDHQLFYEASGTDVSNFLASTFGIGNPYLFSRSSNLERLVQRLLEGSPTAVQLLGGNPFPEGPPTAIRASLYLLQPTTLAERTRTGNWWRRTYLGPHLPPATLDATVWEEWLPDPELFHWDELIWKLRAPRVRTLWDAARIGLTPASAVLASETDITSEDLHIFWSRLVAEVEPEERSDWTRLRQVVERVRGRFSREQLRTCERILGRLSLALLARLEPWYRGERRPRLEVPTFFHLGLLIWHVIALGKGTYEAVYNNPARAVELSADVPPQTGLFLMAIFWLEKLEFHARKFRFVRRYYALDYLPGLSGFLLLIPFLAEQFEVPGEEPYPNFVRRISDGEWLQVEEGPSCPGTDVPGYCSAAPPGLKTNANRGVARPPR